MAKTRYRISVCDGDSCQEVGRMTTDIERAKVRLRKAIERERKRLLKSGEDGRVRGEIHAIERGIVGTDPVYEAEISQGPPRKRGRRAGARSRAASAPPDMMEPREE